MEKYRANTTYYDSNDDHEAEYAIGRAITNSDTAGNPVSNNNLSFARINNRDALTVATRPTFPPLKLQRYDVPSSYNSFEKDNKYDNEEQQYCPLPLSYCESEFVGGYKGSNLKCEPAAPASIRQCLNQNLLSIPAPAPIRLCLNRNRLSVTEGNEVIRTFTDAHGKIKIENLSRIQTQLSTLETLKSAIDTNFDYMNDALMHDDDRFVCQTKPSSLYGSPIFGTSTPSDSYLHSFSIDQMSRLTDTSSPSINGKFVRHEVNPVFLSDRKAHCYSSCVELGAIDLTDEIFSHLNEDNNKKRKDRFTSEPQVKQKARHQKKTLVSSATKPCFGVVAKPMPPPPKLPSSLVLRL